MLAGILKELRIGLSLLIFFTILTGILYPAFITLCAQTFFSWRANGSLVTYQNKVIGSALIGQSFTDPKYFWGRPSATTPFPYNAENSMGSNFGPLNPDFFTLVKMRQKLLKEADPENHQPVPIDLVTASASGLDPEISPEAAFYQTNRIAKLRSLPEAQVQRLVRMYTQKPDFNILGEARVNVLLLNLALDELDQSKKVNKQPAAATTEKIEKVEKTSKPEKHKTRHIRHSDE